MGVKTYFVKIGVDILSIQETDFSIRRVKNSSWSTSLSSKILVSVCWAGCELIK